MPAWRQVVFGLAVAGLPGAAGAEEPRRAPRQGPTVVVTATRGPTEASRSGATSSVVTGDEIEAAHHIETQDALRAVPGLHFVKTANRGGTTSLFLRGGESDYTSILIDGFRINVDGGSFDFENLTNDGVDRIEVVRGAGSTLYGSDAMAGVVNVLTRRGEGPPTATVSSEAGSFGILRERLRFEAGEGEAAYAIDLSHLLQDDGRYENSDFRDFSFSGRFDQRMSETTTLTLLQRSLRSTLGVFTTSAGQRFDVPDPNDTKKRNDSLTGLTVTCVPEPDWESTLKVSRYLYETKFDTREDRSRGAEYSDTSSSTNLTDFERLGIDWQNAYAFGDDERIVAGGAFEQDTLLRATAVPGAATSSEVDDSRGTVSGFAQVDWGFDGRLFLTLGGRVDNSSDFETAATQRQAVAWLLEGGTRLRASHGTGIKAPTFFEIHGSGTVPGLATRGILDPETEKSRTLDGGVDRPFWGERGNFSLTGFYNRYEDLVELESSAIGYSQGGEAFSRGAEAEVEVRPTERVRVRGNWTHLFTRVTDTRTTGTAFVRGEPLLRRPRNAGSATVSLTPTDEWELTFTLISVGDRTDRDFKQASAGVRVENPDYRTVDAAVSWKFRPGWRAFAAGRNLTDATYEEAYGFPADRSNFLAGVEVAFRY